jgi:hypothetical protein
MSASTKSYKARLYNSVQKLVPLGIHIFEAKSDKSPRTKSGFKDAVLDADQVLGWKNDSMAAGRTGAISDVVVIDLDIRDDVDGTTWLMAIRSAQPAFSWGCEAEGQQIKLPQPRTGKPDSILRVTALHPKGLEMPPKAPLAALASVGKLRKSAANRALKMVPPA